jgi:amino acid adenylation domain-containing protein
MFLNSLPISLDVQPGSWRELVQRVAAAGAASVEHRGYPLATIQQEMGTNLNEITFNYTHFHIYEELKLGGGSGLESLNSTGFEQINFDFHIDISRALGQDELRMELIYNAGVYEHELIERVARYYVRAFEYMLEGLDQAHDQQTLLSREEVEQQLEEWNATEVAYPEEYVHEQVEERARRNPDEVAVVCGEQRLSYGELNEKAERLAGYLREAGVEEESRVGIYLRRSVEMMIGVLGVLKAGGAYVPLEVGLPKERVEYMVEDAGVEWVLAESEDMGSLPLAGVDVVVMDGAGEEGNWLEEFAAEKREQEEGATEATEERKEKRKGRSGRELAYILYTSGSTGKPKGVMVEHGGLANYIGHAVKSYMTEGIVGGVVSSPLSFDATITTLLAPLAAGKQVELLGEEEKVLEELAERLFGNGGEREEGEVGRAGTGGGEGWLFKVTPAHLEALEYVERKEKVGRRRHRVVIGGEQLGAARLRRWKEELLPEAVFVNEYGPTETVVGCSVWELKDEEGLKELEGQVAAPIGRPIGNTQVYVVGAGGQLQPVSSVGELYIGGAGVARGYVKQEEITAERFIRNPFVKEGNEEQGSEGKEGRGERLYKTGDLVRWMANGELVYVGRRDQQVKVRGYRIELGEIEAALQEQEGVEQAVVIAKEDESGQKRLVAYVVAKATGGEVDTGNLRQQLQQKLPEYMVPSAFVKLDGLPLTGNGKVDRRALQNLEVEGRAEATEYVGPRNEVEQALCEVWQEVLRRERVGVRDNFFSLGGDSILSIRVVSLLKGRGIVLGVKDIFQHQTIEQLAAKATSGDSDQQAVIEIRLPAEMLISDDVGLEENMIETIL